MLFPRKETSPNTPSYTDHLNTPPAVLTPATATRGGTRPRPNLGWLLPITIPSIQPTHGAPQNTRVTVPRRIPQVGIDPGHDRRLLDPHVDEARAARVAVAARPIRLADVAREEVLDRKRPAVVVLEYLVRRIPRAAAVGIRRPCRLLEGSRILAHVRPPASGAVSQPGAVRLGAGEREHMLFRVQLPLQWMLSSPLLGPILG